MQNNNPQTKKMSRGMKILWAAVAVLAAAALFFAGFFVYYLTLPSEVRSLLWIKDKIQSEYYEDVSDDEFWDAVLDGAGTTWSSIPRAAFRRGWVCPFSAART